MLLSGVHNIRFGLVCLLASVSDTFSCVDVAALIGQLASPDRDVRRAAEEALAAAGPAAVAPVLGVLCDEGSLVPWSSAAMVLRRIGDAAFAPLAEVIASAPSREVARRAGWAFAGVQVSDKAMYASALRHASPKVRADAAYALQVMKDNALPYAQALAGLLADPDQEVCQRAVWAFAAVGAGAVRCCGRCGVRPAGAAAPL